MTDFGSRHKLSHQDGGGDKIDCTGLAGRVNYVDRGDPAASDWSQATLTANDNWIDLNCSAVVPAGAKAIIFVISLFDNTIDGSISMRKNGNTLNINIVSLSQPVANKMFFGQLIVPCDAGRVIEYALTTKVWTSVTVTIHGWLI